MLNQSVNLLEKIRQQYDSSPYPNIPIEKSPKKNIYLLYIHSFVTLFYKRNKKVIDTRGKVILDAGCGAGYKTLVLAEANPGATIIGIDISEESIKLARRRLEYHGFNNVDFHVLAIEELPQLGYQFDYINCDEILYFFSDLSKALQILKLVLKPEGILRGNLHSYIQRFNYYRAQEVYKMMGLMNENPEEQEIEIVAEFMKTLKNDVNLKMTTWNSNFEGENKKQSILMNYLLQGDKGYTIPDMFAALKSADLEFISMVNWRQWELISLFKDSDDLPAFLELSLLDISLEEELRLFELLNPIHRLLDFWCGNPSERQPYISVSDWERSDWEGAKVHLHPQLKTVEFKDDLLECVREIRPFAISQHLSLDGGVSVDNAMAVCLIPLLEQPQSIRFLVERWKQLRPLDPITLKPTDEEEAFVLLQQLLLRLETLGYVMLERLS